MLLSAYCDAYDEWALHNKVVFDGINKKIIVNFGQTDIEVKGDIYSAWKEWAQLRDYAKFLPAIRVIGGDPITNTISAGDIYFLMNGWQVQLNHEVIIRGTLYNDVQGLSPYSFGSGGGVQAIQSNLVQTVNTGGTSTNVPTVQEIRTEIDSNSTRLSAIQSNVAGIPSAVRTNLSVELTHITALQNGLTAGQLTMLTELYAIMGLDPTKPLIVSDSVRTAGAGINQTINSTTNQTTVTRV